VKFGERNFETKHSTCKTASKRKIFDIHSSLQKPHHVAFGVATKVGINKNTTFFPPKGGVIEASLLLALVHLHPSQQAANIQQNLS